MRKRYPLAMLLVLVAAFVLAAALATSAFALPTFTAGSGTTPACQTCHGSSGPAPAPDIHNINASHATMVSLGQCSPTAMARRFAEPVPTACGACHTSVAHIIAEPTHSTIGCNNTPGCHGVVAGAAITSITPSHATVGTSVTIAGTGFGATQGTGDRHVRYHRGDGDLLERHLHCRHRAGVALTGCGERDGDAERRQRLGPFSFTVDAPPVAPVVTSFTPTSAAEGALVSVTGTGFTGATAVTFNGTAATAFTVVSDTEISATVPTGATTGPIAVTTPAGTGTSATDFTIVPAAAPTIASFAPTSGAVGATVTLTGTGFTGATGVTFNGVAATIFTVVNDAQMTAKVPTGATTGAIAVTTPLGTGTSTTNFTVLKATKISIKLSGLTLGVLKRGKSVTATGKVTPLRTGKVTITLQKKKAGKYVRIKTVTRTMSATGTYKWVYRAGHRVERTRILPGAHDHGEDRESYKAGLSVWKNFRVR